MDPCGFCQGSKNNKLVTFTKGSKLQHDWKNTKLKKIYIYINLSLLWWLFGSLPNDFIQRRAFRWFSFYVIYFLCFVSLLILFFHSHLFLFGLIHVLQMTNLKSTSFLQFFSSKYVYFLYLIFEHLISDIVFTCLSLQKFENLISRIIWESKKLVKF